MTTPVILLCVGAAADRQADERHGFEPPASARLAALLARGAVTQDLRLSGDPMTESPEDRWVREVFGVPEDTAPIALSGFAEGLPAPFWRLTPVHLHLGMDHAMLIDPPGSGLDEAHARALAETAAPVFAEAGLTLRVGTPLAWYAQGEPWDLQAWPWPMASGRHIGPYQPAGPAARTWRRLLTEVQMLWHEHPVNEARAQAGLRPINALWLDGFARTPPPPGRGRLVSDDPAWRGAAQACGWTVMPADAVPTVLDELAGPCCLDPGFWRTPRRLGDLAGWRAAWDMADTWLATHEALLRAAANQGRLRVALTGERRLLTIDANRRPAWALWSRLDAMATIAARAPA